MKRFACAFLAFCLLCSITACAGNTEEPLITTAAESKTAAETIKESSGLPERDFEGKEYLFYVMGQKRNVNNYSVEIYSASQNGDVINDAVFERNSALNERYNFVISEAASEDSNMAATASKNITAGDDVYQVLMFSLTDATVLVNSGSLVDLYSAEYLDFSKSWWDSGMTENLSVGGKLYTAMGDINIMDNNATWAVFFNKKLIIDYKLELPYNFVKSDNWTYETYLDMARTAAADLDGNGTMDVNDRWGTVGSYENTFFMFMSAGERLTGKDSDDIPYLVVPTNRTFSAVESIFSVQLDTETSTLHADNHSAEYGNVWSELIRVNFKADLSLFYVAGMLTYTLMRDMESEYGMVPMPKLDTEQPNYYTTLNKNNASSVCIPMSNSDIEGTGFVLEAMASESTDTLTAAYFNVALERKYMRDEESRGMLEIILSSRVFDLASLYDWGGIYSMLSSMTSAKNTDYASKYAAVENPAKSAIEKFTESLK
ncbi:MAG: hypothetical protein ACYCWE_00205 [Eubacteriales bacterium]